MSYRPDSRMARSYLCAALLACARLAGAQQQQTCAEAQQFRCATTCDVLDNRQIAEPCVVAATSCRTIVCTAAQEAEGSCTPVDCTANLADCKAACDADNTCNAFDFDAGVLCMLHQCPSSSAPVTVSHL